MSLDTPPRIFINLDESFQIVEAFNYLIICDNTEFVETYEFDSEDELEGAKDFLFDYIFGYGEYAL